MDLANFSEGDEYAVDFCASMQDQRVFASLSGDTNPIHLDGEYARSFGYPAPVVYGALMVAKLSQIIGLHVPGPSGLWTSLKLDFKHPLFVGVSARVTAKISQISESTRTLVLDVKVTSGDMVIASGRATGTLLPDRTGAQ